MIAQFFFKRPFRSSGFSFSGPAWVFLVVIILLGLVLVGVMS